MLFRSCIFFAHWLLFASNVTFFVHCMYMLPVCYFISHICTSLMYIAQNKLLFNLLQLFEVERRTSTLLPLYIPVAIDDDFWFILLILHISKCPYSKSIPTRTFTSSAMPNWLTNNDNFSCFFHFIASHLIANMKITFSDTFSRRMRVFIFFLWSMGRVGRSEESHKKIIISYMSIIFKETIPKSLLVEILVKNYVFS